MLTAVVKEAVYVGLKVRQWLRDVKKINKWVSMHETRLGNGDRCKDASLLLIPCFPTSVLVIIPLAFVKSVG